MLAAPARMRRSADFSATVRHGRRGGSSSVTVHYAPGSDDWAADGMAVAGATSSPRVGFVVSRAVGSAVVRNRVRRRLRHLMRDRLAALPAGANVVVRAQPAAASASAAALAGDLDRALRRAVALPVKVGS